MISVTILCVVQFKKEHFVLNYRLCNKKFEIFITYCVKIRIYSVNIIIKVVFLPYLINSEMSSLFVNNEE